ncbi:MAG: biotin--[acetyl-CoA-carboxylase] ligase [Hyphomonadaceae bacterium]|nr:biotin--[acetyl-CoA-carboxylase] ligase [Hyphomonadaceae bacterium]
MIDAAAPRVVYEEIDSTNAEAARRAAAGDCGPVWIRTTAQTAGRGRRGRSWTSAPGNLHLTYLGVFSQPPAQLALLSFAAALAVADCADQALGRPVALVKWPNDVLIMGRKLSGILLESGSAKAGGSWLAIGVGVNVAATPGHVDQPAVALRDLEPAKPVTADGVEATLRRRLAFWSGVLERDGFEPLRAAWMPRAHGLGGQAVARLGAEEITGVARGLTADGALELELADKTRRFISAGEVIFGASKAA